MGRTALEGEALVGAVNACITGWPQLGKRLLLLRQWGLPPQARTGAQQRRGLRTSCTFDRMQSKHGEGEWGP